MNRLESETEQPLLENHQEDSQVKYKVTPYRWVIMFILSLNMVSRIIVAIGFNAVAIEIAEAYNLSSTLWVNMCNISFTVTMILFMQFWIGL